MKPFKDLPLLSKIGVVIIMLSLGILGTKLTELPAPKPEEPGMVHDYVIERAQGYCQQYGSSLHYILPKVERTNNYLGNMQYCNYKFYVECQDESLIIMTSQMFCGGVSSIQADESLHEKAPRVIRIQTQG